MNLIECRHLFKHYDGKPVLKDINFSLTTKGPIALVGPNGAGKTTLMSILCGFIAPTKGEVTILGQPISNPALQGALNALPQDAQLDPDMTIASQLSLFAKLQGIHKSKIKAEVGRVLALVDLAEVANNKPKSLSHGMSKRVSIAQALIGQPKIVLLDEPTAGLDPVNARKIRQIVKSQSENTTFIISSHNLDELDKLCEHVLYIDKGQLKESISLTSEQDIDYLTLTMKGQSIKEVTPEVMAQGINELDSVVEVKFTHDDQFVIAHRTTSPFALEQQLFALLAQKQWSYRSLIKGQTLEDKLFS